MDDKTRRTLDNALKDATPRPKTRAMFNMANCYNQVAELAESRVSTTKNADFFAPAIMCRSFAMELLLKFFIAAGMGSSPDEGKTRGHDLPALFDRMNPEFQELIARTHMDRTRESTESARFRRLLQEAGPSPFVDWRYVFEGRESKHLDVALLTSLTESLGLAAQAVVRNATMK